MSERQKVRKCVDHYLDLCGSLADVRDEVASLIEIHGEAAEVDIESDDDSDSVSVTLWVTVDETDEQMRRREEATRRTEARERAEYERLAAKFAPTEKTS